MISRNLLSILRRSAKYFFIFLITNPLTFANAQDDPVGSDQGNIEITSDGQPVWTLPVTVPPGVLGLAPKLTLSVSAQGQLNLGGLSSISRCPGTVLDNDNIFKPVRFLKSDQFCLDGQPLVLISGTEGEPGSIYHTKIESFQKVEAVGSQGNGPASFKITTRNGSKLFYGENTNSKTSRASDGTVVSWGINRLEDLSGNGLWYQYSNIGGSQGPEIALTKILYGSKVQSAAPVEVSFQYENRPDDSSGYQFGTLVQNTKRLKSITTKADNKTARIFKVAYEQAQPGNYSRVSKIEECATNNLCYRPSEFSYADSPVGWQANSSISQPDYLQDSMGRTRGTLIDINNDGWTDWITAVKPETGSAVIETWLGSANGWSSSSEFALPGPLFDYAINQEGIPVGNLADMNGDGLIDYFKAYQQTHADGSKTTARTLWLNTGTGFQVNTALKPPSYTVVILSDGTVEAYDKYVDVNGDGLPDEVRAVRRKSGTNSRITRLNTGSGWEVSDAYRLAGGLFSDHTVGPQGAYQGELIDINGDGLVDFVESAKISGTVTRTRTYLNTGSGWSASSAFRMPVPLMDYSVHDKGVPNAELVDINGDGLIDVWQALRTAGPIDTFNAWINTGTGFVHSPKYTPIVRSTYIQGDGDVNRMTELMDVNNDGRPEIVEQGEWESGLERFYVWEHDGSTWKLNNSLKQYLPSLPFYFHPSGKPSISMLQMADLNGDGNPEALVSNEYSGQQLVYSTPPVAQGEVAGAMTEHINGLGIATRISYGISTDSDLYTSGDVTQNDYPQAYINSPRALVKTVRKMNGLVHPAQAYNNENTGWYKVDHHYEGLKVDTSGRGSLGYASRTITDNRTGVSITSEFHQSYPYTGMSKRMTNTHNGTVSSRTNTNVANKSLYAGKTIFPYASSTLAEAYDPQSGALISITDTQSTYDNYGNTISKTQSVKNQDQSQQFTTQTLTTYKAVNANSWILGLPIQTKVIHTSRINGITDTQQNITTASYNDEGYPIEEVLESGADAVTTAYSYDDGFGNVTSTTITASGQSRKSTTTYSNDGRFPVSSTNPLEHTATVSIDSRWGKPTLQTDPNGIKKQTRYNEFGTVLREDVLWDSDSDPESSEVALAYWCEGRYKSRCPANAVYFAAALDDKGESPQSVYYDAYGRELLKQTSGADLNDNDVADAGAIYIKTVYDSHGRKIKTSRPSAIKNLFVYVEDKYDNYGRVYEKKSPDGKTATISYDGLSVTTTDANGHSTTVTNDLRGKPVKSVDADNNTTTYKYDAKGNLLKTIDAMGNQIVLEYDKFGRKISMDDPDMGEWSYKYDGFGNLTEQTDAKGQTVTMSYDGLNRLVSRSEPEGTTTWTYDKINWGGTKTAIGKLMKVSAPHDNYLRIHFYDEATRPIRERTDINGVIYQSSRGYYRGSQRVAWEKYPSNLVLTKEYDPTGFPMKLESVDLNKFNTYVNAVYDYEDSVKEAKLLEAESKYFLDYYRDLIEGEIIEFDNYGEPVEDGQREGGLNADIQPYLDNINKEVSNAMRWSGLANDTSSLRNQHIKWHNDYYSVYLNHYWTPYNDLQQQIKDHRDEITRLEGLVSREQTIIDGHERRAREIEAQANSIKSSADALLNQAKNAWRAACIAGGKENHDKLSGALGLNCAFGPKVDGKRYSPFALGNGRRDVCWTISRSERDGYDMCTRVVDAFSWLPTSNRTVYTRVTERVCDGDSGGGGGGGGFGGGQGSGKNIVWMAKAVVLALISFTEQAKAECYNRDKYIPKTVKVLHNANFGAVESNMNTVETKVGQYSTKIQQYNAKIQQAQSEANKAIPHYNAIAGLNAQIQTQANHIINKNNQAQTYVEGLQIYGALFSSHGNVSNGLLKRYESYFANYEIYAGNFECKTPSQIPASVHYVTDDSVEYKPSPIPGAVLRYFDDKMNQVPVAQKDDDGISAWYINHTTRKMVRAVQKPKFEKGSCKNGELWAQLDEGRIGTATQALYNSGLLFQRDYYYFLYSRYVNPINDLIEQANDKYGLVKTTKQQYKNSASTYWQALAYQPDGQIKRARYGNGVESNWAYDKSGRTGMVKASKDTSILQNMFFRYDNVGNLDRRENHVEDIFEDFTYDNLNRLTSATLAGTGAVDYQLTGNQTQSFQYDVLGNITHKSDVGDYYYGENGAGVHALTSTTGGPVTANFTYDANGNQLSGHERVINYYSYNKPKMIDKMGGRSTFSYGPERQLIYQVERVNTSSGFEERETAYVGEIYERTTKDGVSESVHHLTMSGHTVAVLKTESTERATNNPNLVNIEATLGVKRSLHYLHQDHLDSVVMITDENGNVVERNHYDAFGKKRMIVPSGQVLAAGLLPITDRSFTDHRYLVGQELIHMKGRVYDPTFGRFLSADPHIQSPLNSQSLNRYSYVLNNPLSLTDPSGYLFSWLKKLFKKILKIVKKIIKKIVAVIKKVIKAVEKVIQKVVMALPMELRVIAAVVVAVVAPQFLKSYVAAAFKVIGITSAAAITAGTAFATGALAGLVSTGSFKAAFVSGLTAVAFAGVGNFFANVGGTAGKLGFVKEIGHIASKGVAQLTTLGRVAKTIAHGIVGGLSSKLSGGSFSKSFLSTAFTQFVAPGIDKIQQGVQTLGAVSQRVLAAALVGGVASKLAGGSFSMGARLGAFSRWFNDEHGGENLWKKFKKWHYERNKHNVDLPESAVEAERAGWERQPNWKNAEHRYGPGNEDNVKYLSPDGHREAIYNAQGSLVTDYVNAGTYNYGTNPLSHILLDYLPYRMLGNTPEQLDDWLQNTPEIPLAP